MPAAIVAVIYVTSTGVTAGFSGYIGVVDFYLVGKQKRFRLKNMKHCGEQNGIHTLTDFF